MKKHLTVLMLAVVVSGTLLLTFNAVSQEPCPIPDVRPDLVNLIILLLDTNHDRHLSLEEIQRVYPEMEPGMFNLVDLNNDGRLSASEIRFAMAIAGLDPLEYIDANGDRLIQYEEVDDFLTPELFDRLDYNNNGVIDCEDYDYFMTRPAYGDGDECGSADMMHFIVEAAFLYLDTDGDRHISYDEIAPLLEPDYAALVIDVLDRDKDGYVSPAELQQFLVSLPFDIIRFLDENGDGALQYEEVAEFIPPEMFSALDYNGDGVLDCADLAFLPIDPAWGVLPFAEYDMLSLHLLTLLRNMFAALDENDDGLLSYEEVLRFILLPQRLFDALDINGDGFISWDELEAWFVALSESHFEPGLTFTRSIVDSKYGHFFTPGGTIRVRLDINASEITPQFSVTELLPKGWGVDDVSAKGASAVTVQSVENGEKLIFEWQDSLPAFPLEITYRLLTPVEAAGAHTVFGHASFKTIDGVPQTSGLIPTTFIELPSPADTHSADMDGDWRISLSELLRVIQLYNSDGYHVEPDTDDGYAPGLGSTNGMHHSADYLGDWRITLPELLRVIQLYNAPSGFYYIADNTEDGYMPAPF